jgi:hypothetical protein
VTPGGTGVAVATLVDLARDLASDPEVGQPSVRSA